MKKLRRIHTTRIACKKETAHANENQESEDDFNVFQNIASGDEREKKYRAFHQKKPCICLKQKWLNGLDLLDQYHLSYCIKGHRLNCVKIDAAVQGSAIH